MPIKTSKSLTEAVAVEKDDKSNRHHHSKRKAHANEGETQCISTKSDQRNNRECSNSKTSCKQQKSSRGDSVHHHHNHQSSKNRHSKEDARNQLPKPATTHCRCEKCTNCRARISALKLHSKLRPSVRSTISRSDAQSLSHSNPPSNATLVTLPTLLPSLPFIKYTSLLARSKGYDAPSPSSIASGVSNSLAALPLPSSRRSPLQPPHQSALSKVRASSLDSAFRLHGLPKQSETPTTTQSATARHNKTQETAPKQPPLTSSTAKSSSSASSSHPCSATTEVKPCSATTSSTAPAKILKDFASTNLVSLTVPSLRKLSSRRLIKQTPKNGVCLEKQSAQATHERSPTSRTAEKRLCTMERRNRNRNKQQQQQDAPAFFLKLHGVASKQIPRPSIVDVNCLLGRRFTQPPPVSFPVILRVYDLTGGKACEWSKLVLGRQLDGVWHSSLLAFEYEYFYGDGILKMRPSSVENAIQMKLCKETFMGYTTMTKAKFEKFLVSISLAFTPATYDLISWNCNHFTNSCLWWLLAKDLPDYILHQHQKIASAPIGPLILLLTRIFSRQSSLSVSGSGSF